MARFDKELAYQRPVVTSRLCTLSEILPLYTVYVTVCDLEKSFSFNTKIKITGHTCFPIRM